MLRDDMGSALCFASTGLLVNDSLLKKVFEIFENRKNGVVSTRFIYINEKREEVITLSEYGKRLRQGTQGKIYNQGTYANRDLFLAADGRQITDPDLLKEVYDNNAHIKSGNKKILIDIGKVTYELVTRTVKYLRRNKTKVSTSNNIKEDTSNNFKQNKRFRTEDSYKFVNLFADKASQETVTKKKEHDHTETLKSKRSKASLDIKNQQTENDDLAFLLGWNDPYNCAPEEETVVFKVKPDAEEETTFSFETTDPYLSEPFEDIHNIDKDYWLKDDDQLEPTVPEVPESSNGPQQPSLSGNSFTLFTPATSLVTPQENKMALKYLLNSK